MDKNLSLTKLNGISVLYHYPISIGNQLWRRRLIIIVLVSLSTLIYSVYSINDILSRPLDDTYRSEQSRDLVDISFDQKTIGKIEALGDNTSPTLPSLPSGRTNPFSR